MHFKFVVVSVACFAFVSQPAHSLRSLSDGIGAFASIPIQIAKIPFNIAKTKTTAVVKGVTDVASTLVNGAGLKVKALASATSSVNGAVADGLIAIGDRISQAGDDISNQLDNDIPFHTRVLVKSPRADGVYEELVLKTPTVIEQALSGIREKKIIEFPVESYLLRGIDLKVQEPMAAYETAPRFLFETNKISAVWNALRNHRTGHISNDRSGLSSRPYENVEAPQVYRRPVIESFKVQNK